ncbi:hypothetical protein JW979_15770 [bacterium]|nr:hypothetical protein [candidate division CSSED10-310 bacterium]
MARFHNDMMDSGIITNYAVFGAIAQIYAFSQNLGYIPEGEAIRAGDWPVQFTPVFNPLTEEAMEKAEVADLEDIPFRVVRADYLAVIALSVGRSNDFDRIFSYWSLMQLIPNKLPNLQKGMDFPQNSFTSHPPDNAQIALSVTLKK